jgi:hypothetical protein
LEHHVNEEQIPQHEPAPKRAEYAVSDGDGDELATIEASGDDLRSTLEAGLRAVLALSGRVTAAESATDKSAAVHGEGADHAGLFAAMADDLIAQLELHGSAAEVTVDGVLRRDDGAYVAWGYVRGCFDERVDRGLPSLAENPTAREDEGGRLVLTARLRRT